MKKEKSIASKIISWITIIVLIFITYKLFGVYKKYYFNGFVKAESTIGVSQFTRDDKTKYSKYDSYKIVSSEQNNAAFYKTVDVEPNTVYRVSCMIKTQDVIPSEVNTDGGANICIIEAPEISKTVTRNRRLERS